MNLQIKSLVVQHCGPLHDVEISFMAPDGRPRPVTVIGGANGSGKTTILELIYALLQTLHPERAVKTFELSILKRTREAKIDLLLQDKDVHISFSKQDPMGGPSYSPTAFSSVATLRQAIPNDNLSAILPFEVYRATEQSLSQPIERTLAPSILYFPDYRRITSAQGTNLSREDVIYQWTYRYETIQAFAGSLNAYLVWLEYAQPNVFEMVKRFLNEMVLVDKSISHVNRSDLQTIVKLPGGISHPLDKLSSGEQNLLIIMLELWRRLLPGSIVLIDEIENSLHPAFQHRLAEALLKLQARIPFQLIVTTHAPAFLDAFGADSTLVLTEF